MTQPKLTAPEFTKLLTKYNFTWTHKKNINSNQETMFWPPLAPDSVKGNELHYDIEIKYTGATKLAPVLMRDRIFDILCDIQSYDTVATTVNAAYIVLQKMWKLYEKTCFNESLNTEFKRNSIETKISILNTLSTGLKFFATLQDFKQANYDAQKKVTTRGNRERLMEFGQILEGTINDLKARVKHFQTTTAIDNLIYFQAIDNYITIDLNGSIRYRMCCDVVVDVNSKFEDLLRSQHFDDIVTLPEFKSVVQMHTSQTTLIDNLKTFV